MRKFLVPPSIFALLHILVPKWFVLSCSRFVGGSPTQAKIKIQGFTLTDKFSAVRISSARGENMKNLILTLLPAIFLGSGSCYGAPAPDPDPVVAKSVQIIRADGVVVADDNDAGNFEPVMVDQSTTSGVALQFPASFTNKPVAIEAPDGGTLSTNSATVDTNGNLAFSFQVSDQPGVHRVIVIDPNPAEDSPHIVGVVQFEVPPLSN
jgi:hypothetical protein